MIYYFNAIKSLVDTKAKNSLTSYPAAGYLRGHRGPAFPLRRSKTHFDSVDRACGGK